MRMKAISNRIFPSFSDPFQSQLLPKARNRQTNKQQSNKYVTKLIYWKQVGNLTRRKNCLFTQKVLKYTYVIHSTIGWDSSVGIATRYMLVGPGIESRWRRDFLHPSRPTLGPNFPLLQWVPAYSGGESGRGVALTTQPHLESNLNKE